MTYLKIKLCRLKAGLNVFWSVNMASCLLIYGSITVQYTVVGEVLHPAMFHQKRPCLKLLPTVCLWAGVT